MVFNATFNNISVISWRSVLLLEETGEPRENHRSAADHRDNLSHSVASSTPRLRVIRTHSVSGGLIFKYTTQVLVDRYRLPIGKLVR